MNEVPEIPARAEECIGCHDGRNNNQVRISFNKHCNSERYPGRPQSKWLAVYNKPDKKVHGKRKEEGEGDFRGSIAGIDEKLKAYCHNQATPQGGFFPEKHAAYTAGEKTGSQCQKNNR